MKYNNIVEGLFIERPNRFIARVLINGKEEVCHVKNTGRCKELLIPMKTIVYLEDHFDSPSRKTRYSLIAVRKKDRIINMDSQVPNLAAYEWLSKEKLFKNILQIKREVKYGDSRFDIYIEHYDTDNKLRKVFVEVKGVTLENDNIVSFPDAPTIRGVKHLNELLKAKKEGYDAYIFFVIQMENVDYFMPNDLTHKEFGDTLRKVNKEGVNLLAYDCNVTYNSLEILHQVNIKL